MGLLNKGVKLVGSLLFGGAALLYFGTQVFVFGHVAGITNSMNGPKNSKDPLKKAGITIVNHRDDSWSGYKSGYLEMAQIDNIKADRFIRFSTLVPVTKLLDAGEKRPDKDMQDLFAKARSVHVAREECERALKTIASACKVERADGRFRDNGKVYISGTLRFVQKADFGDLDKTTTWGFEHIKSSLTKSSETTTPTGGDSKRMALYRKAVKDCNVIKKREGNCAITSVSVDTGTRQRDGRIRVSGRASYSFLTEIDS